MVQDEQSVAIVTGASRGIGLEIALSLVEKGVTVFAVARNPHTMPTPLACSRLIPWKADLREEGTVADLFEEVGKRFGTLDILVNNAGQGQGSAGRVCETPTEVFDELYSVNLRGAFLCCRYALNLMLPRKKGYIVNMVSVAGVEGFRNQGAYCATKHGLLGLTKALSQECRGSGVRVSAILPGRVDTEMLRRSTFDGDLSSVLHPTDVARAVLFLLSVSEEACVDHITIRDKESKPFW